MVLQGGKQRKVVRIASSSEVRLDSSKRRFAALRERATVYVVRGEPENTIIVWIYLPSFAIGRRQR